MITIQLISIKDKLKVQFERQNKTREIHHGLKLSLFLHESLNSFPSIIRFPYFCFTVLRCSLGSHQPSFCFLGHFGAFPVLDLCTCFSLGLIPFSQCSARCSHSYLYILVQKSLPQRGSLFWFLWRIVYLLGLDLPSKERSPWDSECHHWTGWWGLVLHSWCW